jgi:hypothetical protein
MNNDLYYDIVRYLGDGVIREDADEWRRRLLETAKKNFELQGTLLFKKRKDDRLLVIQRSNLDTILLLSHNHPLAGHIGADNTIFRIQQNHWWPGMTKDIRQHVQNCDTCQKRKKNKDQSEAASAEIIPKPFYHIGIDIMGPLPRTLTGKRYIVLAIDFFTKWIEAEAIEEADAQTVVKFIHSKIVCQHGVPEQITSDRGTEFLNELVQEFERTYRIKHIKTTAYHPQGNGLTERANQTVKNTIAKITKTYDAWDHYLDSALFAVRTIRQNSTTFSPFELVYGRNPRREFNITSPNSGSYEDSLWSYITRDIHRLQLIRRKAAIFIDKAQERQRQKQDKTARGDKLQIGDQVLLYRNIVESSWSAKLEPKWEGPYLVRLIKGQNIYLRRLDGTILPTAIHRNHVKKYQKRT